MSLAGEKAHFRHCGFPHFNIELLHFQHTGMTNERNLAVRRTENGRSRRRCWDPYPQAGGWVNGLSTIFNQAGVDHTTVRTSLTQNDCASALPAQATKPSKPDPFKGLLPRWLTEGVQTWHVQQHTTQRIHDRPGGECPGIYDGSLPWCSCNAI